MKITLPTIPGFRLHLLSLACVAFVFVGANAQSTVPSNNTIRVLPQPKVWKTTTSTFKLTPETRVVLADPRSDDDRFAAQDFITDLKETARVSLSLDKGVVAAPFLSVRLIFRRCAPHSNGLTSIRYSETARRTPTRKAT